MRYGTTVPHMTMLIRIFANSKPFVRWFSFGMGWSVVLTFLMNVSCMEAFVIGPFFTSAAFTKGYELDKVYSYLYETSVLLNEPLKVPESTPKDVGFKFDVEVDLIPVWQNPNDAQEQLMELKISVPKLSVKARQGPVPTTFANKASRLDNVKLYPFYLLRDSKGLVTKIFYHEEELLSIVNIKKGISSNFQYQLTKDETRSEIDSSGRCDVTYAVKRLRVEKIKANCLPVEASNYFNHTSQVLSADISSQWATTFELNEEDSSIKKAMTVETHVMRPEARKSSGVEVIGKHSIAFKGRTSTRGKTVSGKSSREAVAAISKVIGSSLIADNLATTPDPKECIACKSLTDLVGSFRKSLLETNLGTQSASIAFLRLLRKMRESDYKVIKSVLVNKKNDRVLPQLLDIVAATQTIPAHKAAMAVLNFDNANIALVERYLLGLSLSTHALEYVIEDILKTAKKGWKNPHLVETLALTLGSLTKTFALNSLNKKQTIINSVDTHLEEALSGCPTEKCKLIFIRALKNRQGKHHVPLLLKYVKGTIENSTKKLSIYAMRAIQTFPQDFIDSKVIKELEKVVFELDAFYDSSVRAMASEVLLRGPPREDLIKDMFLMLSRQNTSEFNTLLLGHIKDLSEKREDVYRVVRSIVSECNLSNYNLFGQGGKSTAFSRSLIQDASVNASFINMLEINGGILKRSNVDVFIAKDDTRTRLLSFGMFAGGLSMFGGGDDDGEEAHAGIEITLLDTQLRPFILFTGHSNLMKHVMGGTASSRTTALQGSMLLQDHSQLVPLLNGLNVDLLLTGVVSYDFAGSVRVSLWYRTANSLVEVGAATVVQGQARVDNHFVQTMIEFNVGSQAQLNFKSDLNFSGNIMMCLQMVQPSLEVIDNVRKLERIPGSNYVLRKYKRKSSILPGKTYVMNRKNTELCTAMNRPSS